ncbi:MAG: hypothetical protein WKG03_12960 [Telluria sp.]
MTLGELALTVNWTFGLVIDGTDVLKQACAAARQYLAWGAIASLGNSAPAAGLDDLDEHCDLTPSEWGIIKPLVALYVERENARALEASRGQGVDVYGRSVSEIDQAITQYETVDLPRMAFSAAPETI